MKVAFLGTPLFAVGILEYIIALPNIELSAVVTMPDRPKGRGQKMRCAPVKTWLLDHHLDIPLYQFEKVSSPQGFKILSALDLDVIIVVGFGEILKSEILDIPKIASLNIHTSLLPKYRGAAPVQRALMDGAKETGVTIMRMDPKMDTGAILHQEALSIPSHWNSEDVHKAMLPLANQGLDYVLKKLLDNSLVPEIQDDKQSTKAPKIQKHECKIDWTRDAYAIHNQIRALAPSPGAYTEWLIGDQKKRIKILKAAVFTGLSSLKNPIEIQGKNLLVSCGSGVLAILTLQVEGKGKLAAHEFINGFNSSLSLL